MDYPLASCLYGSSYIYPARQSRKQEADRAFSCVFSGSKRHRYSAISTQRNKAPFSFRLVSVAASYSESSAGTPCTERRGCQSHPTPKSRMSQIGRKQKSREWTPKKISSPAPDLINQLARIRQLRRAGARVLLKAYTARSPMAVPKHGCRYSARGLYWLQPGVW